MTPCAFLAASASLVRWRDQPALLLGQRGVEVQHERIGVSAQLGDDERRLVGHQAGDEVDVAAEPVELGDDDRRLVLPGRA